jgi:drug/metabolite transporter (DMT)-like permease
MMEPGLAVAAFGLLSAISWGAADFSGGIASRRSPALGVVLVSQPLGGLLALLLALVRGEGPPAPADFLWAALAGISGPTALIFFYRGLAAGRMAVVAPIAGVLGAAMPVLAGAILEGIPAPGQLAGIVLGLAAVLLVTRITDTATHRPGGVGFALIAGLGFGAFFIFLGRVGPGPVFTPLVLVRVVATILMVAIVLVGRSPWRLSRASYVPVIVAGTLDAGGNLWYLLAAQQGRLDVAAVLASLYPVVTIVLAAAVLKERIGRVQAVGILAAAGAIVLIAAG